MKTVRPAAATAAAVLIAALLVPLGAAPALADDAPDIVDSWSVTTAATFTPTEGILPAFRPGLTEAANGDLVASFNTSTDANPGGELRVIRSTDDGQTWGASSTVATSTLYGSSGSVHSNRGMTTLADGTILLPYNDGKVNSQFTNVESSLFVARSTDNGVTWSGTSTPVTLPTPFHGLWADGGSIIELPGGDILLGVYGVRTLVSDWATDPMRNETGVLRSTDGGLTWSSYTRIAYDPQVPNQDAAVNSGYDYEGGPNEFAMHRLRDGRLMAMIRYESLLGPLGAEGYLSYSSDDGATWSEPMPTGYDIQAHMVATAGCTASLPGDAEKLWVASRGGFPGNWAGAWVGASYDAGITVQGRVQLVDPLGSTSFGPGAGEPVFHRLNATDTLVLFQITSGGPARIVANVLRDEADPADCVDDYDAAVAAHEAQPTVYVQRADSEDWPWRYAIAAKAMSATSTVGSLIGATATTVICKDVGSSLQLTPAGSTTPLSRSATLSAAGVEHGDLLIMKSSAPPTQTVRFGLSELDVNPETRPMGSWNTACATASGIAVDYRAASIGLEIAPGLGVSGISLRAREASTTMTQANWKILVSDDNDTYTPVTGWTFAETVVGGRVQHAFTGLDIESRYVKVANDRTGTAYTFSLADLATDVSVTLRTLPQ